MCDTCFDVRSEYKESVWKVSKKITADTKKMRTKSLPSYISSQLLKFSSKAVTCNVTLVFKYGPEIKYQV